VNEYVSKSGCGDLNAVSAYSKSSDIGSSLETWLASLTLHKDSTVKELQDLKDEQATKLREKELSHQAEKTKLQLFT